MNINWTITVNDIYSQCVRVCAWPVPEWPSARCDLLASPVQCMCKCSAQWRYSRVETWIGYFPIDADYSVCAFCVCRVDGQPCTNLNKIVYDFHMSRELQRKKNSMNKLHACASWLDAKRSSWQCRWTEHRRNAKWERGRERDSNGLQLRRET